MTELEVNVITISCLCGASTAISTIHVESGWHLNCFPSGDGICPTCWDSAEAKEKK